MSGKGSQDSIEGGSLCSVMFVDTGQRWPILLLFQTICFVSPKCEHLYHQKSVAVHLHLKDKLQLLPLGYLASGVEDLGKLD